VAGKNVIFGSKKPKSDRLLGSCELVGQEKDFNPRLVGGSSGGQIEILFLFLIKVRENYSGFRMTIQFLTSQKAL
jgi:hypothetical protein